MTNIFNIDSTYSVVASNYIMISLLSTEGTEKERQKEGKGKKEKGRSKKINL